MRRKSIGDYLLLTLFSVGLVGALCASIDFAASQNYLPALVGGRYVLAISFTALAVLFLSKSAHKLLRNHKKLKTIVFIILCGLFVGTAIFLRCLVIQRISIEPVEESLENYTIGLSLLNGETEQHYYALFPEKLGFPMLILWPTFAIFGASVRNALYANLVCSVISIFLAGHIARRIAGRTGALVAVALMSLWPSHILFSNMVATEPSFTMLILLAADMMTSILDRRKGSLYDAAPSRMLGVMALLGIVLAIAGAIRPMAVILLAAYCVVQLCVTGDPMNEIRVEGARYATSQPLVCIVLVLVCYFVTGSVINRAISDIIGEQPASGLYASGYNLMVGLNTQSNGLWNETDSEFFAQAYDATKSATAAHQACMEVAAQRIQSEPENVLNLMVYKFRDLWRTDDFGIDWNLLWTEQQGTLTPELRSLLESIRPIGRVMYMAVLLFAALGAMEAWRRRLAPNAMILICMLFFLGTALSHMLLETQVRYHYNMIPFLILLAAWTVRSWSKTAAEKEDVRVIYVDRPENAEEKKDNIHFDMAKAIAEGHIHVSVTENVARTEEASKMEDSAKSSVENT